MQPRHASFQVAPAAPTSAALLSVLNPNNLFALISSLNGKFALGGTFALRFLPVRVPSGSYRSDVLVNDWYVKFRPVIQVVALRRRPSLMKIP